MRLLVILFFLIIGSTAANAQIFGGRIGVATNQISSDSIYIQNNNGVDTFRLSMENGKNSTLVGVFFRMPMGAFYLEIEPMFATLNYPIRIQNLQDWNGGSLVKQERFTTFDVGLSAGFRLWKAVRFQGGIRSQIWTNYQSELNNYTNDYTNDWSRTIQSYHAGIGLDIVRVTLDFGFERTINGIGDNVSFLGNSTNFNANRNRFSVKVGVRLFSYEED
ncbi:MAG: hypothetical protein ACPG19_12220 [Saprospiraceae bacterium]